ncbi:MAG: hypothetical protein QF685_09010 [Verrucomicrobiota bacterium]|nr:hypothetical protein [Verrucomicrobiota bacterium]
MYRAAVLVVCLAAACSGGKGGDANQTAPAKKTASQSSSPNGKKIDPPPPVAPERRGFDPPRLYKNDLGKYFEIFDQDRLPYGGKIVTYHNEEQKIIATEKIFEKGDLLTEREYWPDTKLKLEITYNLGATTTNRFDQDGNKIEPPPAASPAPKDRSLNWTYNYNTGNARLELLGNTSLLLKHLGEPDEKFSNAWTYNNMRIIGAPDINRPYTTVKFNITGNTVSSIALQ